VAARRSVTVSVDPRFRLAYHNYFLQGFADAGIGVRFRRLDRPPGLGAAMEIDGRRIWTDTADMARIELEPYDWCDILGKVNCTPEDAAEHRKIRLLGPVFGVRQWELPFGYLRWPQLVCRGAEPRATLAGLRFQGHTRLSIEAYRPAPSESGYVFHRSRPWAGKHAGANSPRERFIDAVARSGLAHEASLTDERISLAEYLDRTRRSSSVFNCPAVHGCLGWKLGEYLALGKAIISTPLTRALPEPLVHGTHVHFVSDDTEAMLVAIRQIDRDDDYRRHLERGARDWYERNLAPAALVRRLLD
jgi:hypothetical protein